MKSISFFKLRLLHVSWINSIKHKKNIRQEHIVLNTAIEVKVKIQKDITSVFSVCPKNTQKETLKIIKMAN